MLLRKFPVVLAAIASIAIEMVGGNQYRSRELTGLALTQLPNVSGTRCSQIF
jgi:hypothetical protein